MPPQLNQASGPAQARSTAFTRSGLRVATEKDGDRLKAELQTGDTSALRQGRGGQFPPASPPLPPECLVWLGLLVLCNLPFGSVSPVACWAFLPDYVLAGEWWRLITFPFVHVSGYHLLLDAGAFLGLYAMWEERSVWRRLVLVGASCAGSLVGAACVAEFARLGLCGLSGAAHGLAALVALESIRGERCGRLARVTGWAVLVAVVAKSVTEAVCGQVIFGGLHPGSVGVPNPVCHLGGVVGALLARVFVATRVPFVRQRATRTA